MSTELIETVHAADLETIGFAPAHAVVAGKSKSDKQRSLIDNMPFSAKMYLLGKAKGKALVALQKSIGTEGDVMIVNDILTGNYQSVAVALAFVLGENVSIPHRQAFEGLRWGFQHQLDNLKDGGWSKTTDKDTGLQKPSARRVALCDAIALLDTVNEAVRMEVEQRRAAKLQRKLEREAGLRVEDARVNRDAEQVH